MLKIIITIVILMVSKLSFSQTISVKINELKNDKGVCFVCLYNKAHGFPDSSKNAVSCSKAKIIDKVAVTSFKDVAAGTYAIAVFHDENSNGKLDENFLGIPKEGYGVSNNILPKMSKPKFEAAKFTLTTDKSLSINIKY
jgi:uncharacterized protein (DUF2141 family)